MNTPHTLLRLDHLKLKNFRCFDKISVDFHPDLTVIVAENGSGKTATLDAIALALDVFVKAVAYDKQSQGFDRMDVRMVPEATAPGTPLKMTPQLPTEFSAKGIVGGTNVTWGKSLEKIGADRARSSTRDAKTIYGIARQMRTKAEDAIRTLNVEIVTMPIVAYYGTGRLWNLHYLTKEKRSVWPSMHGRYSAYQDCLTSYSSFKAFSAWYQETANHAHSSVSKASDPENRPHEHLAAVREAVGTVLNPTGWTNIDWPFFPARDDGAVQSDGPLVVEHSEKGRIPATFLSDGIRTMVGLVGDLAHRCVQLNPHLGDRAARETPGVLLIDEVDMHLHPSWQQLIVKLLHDAFPKMQMVLSTHSPQVVSTVRKENIRILGQKDDATWVAREPSRNPFSHSNLLSLEAVMGVAACPPMPLTATYREYQCLVGDDKHDSDRAIELRNLLENEWGKTDSELLLMDVAIRKNETLRKFRKQQS